MIPDHEDKAKASRASRRNIAEANLGDAHANVCRGRSLFSISTRKHLLRPISAHCHVD